MAHAVRKERPSESIFQVLFRATEKDPSGVIPDAIYSLLPHLYVCAGLLTVVVLRNWIAAFSALAWFTAAAIIWVRRYRYRSPFERSGGRIDLPTVTDDQGHVEEVVQIFWQATFECGHAIIDAQHRHLFGLGNKLAKAVIAERLPGDIAWLLDELVEDMTSHFCTEEAVLVKVKHPIAGEHQAMHRELLGKVAELRERHHAGEVSTSELVGFIVNDAIVGHIAKEAVEFSSVWSRRHSRTRRSRRDSH